MTSPIRTRGNDRRGRPREVDQLTNGPLDPLQLPRAARPSFSAVYGSGPRALRICTKELNAARGLPTSWAMPAASRPKAAIFSCWITRACEARGRRSVRRSAVPGRCGPGPAPRSTARALGRPHATTRPATSLRPGHPDHDRQRERQARLPEGRTAQYAGQARADSGYETRGSTTRPPSDTGSSSKSARAGIPVPPERAAQALYRDSRAAAMKTDSINETHSGQRSRNTSPIRQNAQIERRSLHPVPQERANRPGVMQTAVASRTRM